MPVKSRILHLFAKRASVWLGFSFGIICCVVNELDVPSCFGLKMSVYANLIVCIFDRFLEENIPSTKQEASEAMKRVSHERFSVFNYAISVLLHLKI